VGGLSGGMAADTKHKRKGMPFWVMILLVVVGLGLVSRIPWLLSKGIGKATTVNVKRLMSSNQPPSVAVSRPTEFAPLHERGKRSSVFQEPVAPLPQQDDVFLTGLTVVNGQTVVMLSDGSMLRPNDGDLQLVTDKFVVVQNKVYKWPKLGQLTRPVGSAYYQPPGAKGVIADGASAPRIASVPRKPATVHPFSP
jgi:hypothetical protein